MIVCPRCGRENPEDSKFCAACGTRLMHSPLADNEERKIVTVLFCDLVGFTARSDEADPEDVKALLRPYHGRLKKEIEAIGGTLDKFLGDGVLGVFGAPVAHEDDPERAVRAALSIQRAIGDLNADNPGTDLAARIGIDTGEAVVALGVTGPQIGESVTGDVVNTASRLQAVAPVGGIVVGEATHRATLSEFFYSEPMDVTVKGKAGSLRVWQPKEPRGRFGVDFRETPDTPFVGRDVEVAMLTGVFQRTVRESSPQLVTITGEPGVGKSRLIGELFHYLEGLPDSLEIWRQGRCLPYGEGVTFWALAEIVKAQAGILESDSPEEAQSKLEAIIEAVIEDESDRDWILARMAPLVGVRPGEQMLEDRTEAYTAWLRFFEGLSLENPLILVFEDLHWADPAMLEFIDHLVEWATQVPLLVVCASRPELFEKNPDWGGGKRNTTTIALSPLSEKETARLISGLMNKAVLPAETQSLLMERAGGNPLYAEEFVRMLTDRGLMDPKTRKLTAPANLEIPVPDTVQALIAARLDTLPPDRKALLHGAAVVGEVFWVGALAFMEAVDEEFVRDGLHEVSRKELVRPARVSSVQGQAEFAFWHLLVRDVAYGQIPRAAKGAKHRAAAEWLQRIAGDRVSDHAEMLAHHYLVALELAIAQGDVAVEAELQPITARFLVLAGDRAKGLDVRRAASYYRRALELLPPGNAGRPAAQAKAAEAANADGRLVDAETLYAAAIEGFRAAGKRKALGEAIGMRARTKYRMGENREAEAMMRESIELLEAEAASPELVRVYNRAAGVYLGEDNAASLLRAEQARSMAESLGMQDEIVRALQFRGAALCELGDPAGMDDLREAIRLGLELGLGEETAIAHGNLALQLWLWDGPAAALSEWHRMTELAESRGFAMQGMWGRAGSLEILFDLGEWDELLRVSDDMLEWDRLRGRSQLGTFADIYAAHVLVRRGNVAEAARLTERFVPEIRKMGYAEFIAPALIASILVEQERGEPAAARTLADEFVKSTADQPSYALQYLPPVLQVLVESGEDVATVEAVIPPEPKMEPVRLRNSRLMCRAIVAEARGETEHAAELYADAAARWGEYGFLLARGQSLAGRARCLRTLGSSDESSAVADEANAIMRELGVVVLASDAGAAAEAAERMPS